jgi:ABC-2 type transport system permease protein
MKYSQFKAMMAIAKASFRSITRSPSAVVFTLVFPLVFITVFGFLKGGNVTLNVALATHSDQQNSVYMGLISNPAFSVHHDMDSVEQRTLLLKGKLDAIIDIQKVQLDSSSTYDVNLYTTMASAEKGIIVRSMLEHLIDKSNLSAAKIITPLATLKQQELKGRTYSTIDFILPGQLGFSLLSTGVFGTAFVFFNLRQTLVIKRFFATPIRKPFIVMGEALARMVFAMLGAAFLIALGHYAFGFTLINGLTTVAEMLVLSAMGLIVFMGFGFVVSGIAKSESTIPPLANIITLPQFLLSGTFFGVENFPTWLQPICKMLPLTYLNDAMRKVAFEGASLLDLGPQLAVITLWGVIIYAIAVKVFRWE